MTNLNTRLTQSQTNIGSSGNAGIGRSRMELPPAPGTPIHGTLPGTPRGVRGMSMVSVFSLYFWWVCFLGRANVIFVPSLGLYGVNNSRICFGFFVPRGRGHPSSVYGLQRQASGSDILTVVELLLFGSAVLPSYLTY